MVEAGRKLNRKALRVLGGIILGLVICWGVGFWLDSASHFTDTLSIGIPAGFVLAIALRTCLGMLIVAGVVAALLVSIVGIYIAFDWIFPRKGAK
jgi:hypothetical protein